MKVLIVGAGLTGAVVAERLSRQHQVTVIDRRNHIAGNAYDEGGVHRYGPHVFHTNSDMVWEYLSRFTEWRRYEHRVLGLVQGRLMPIPFNLTSLAIMMPDAVRVATNMFIQEYGWGASVPVLKLLDDPGLIDVAEYVYQEIFEGYTLKQWGMLPEQLSPSVTARVPVRISHDDRYFQDKHQAMPAKGYTAMVRRMLEGAKVKLEAAYEEESHKADRIIYTGAIDEFFGYSLDPLPYRSLEFEHRTYPQRQHQPVGTVNYPSESIPFTRITEMGHLTGQWGEKTNVVVEYPKEHVARVNEPYYPVPCDENREHYRRYAELAKTEAPHVTFCGRLGDYQYYNMDQAVARALKVAEAVQ